jgi:hypothetical protein
MWVISNASTGTNPEGLVRILEVSSGQVIPALIMNCVVNQDQRLLRNILESMIEFLKLD